MGLGRFQLSLGRIFMAVTLIACAFANLGNRLDKACEKHPLTGVILFPTFWTILCSGIGALRGQVTKWALGGFIISVIVMVVAVTISLT